MSKPRLLVAGTPPAIQTIRQVLAAEADCIPASSIDEAMHGFEQHPDMILCNVRFDESRMINLLEAAKSMPETRDTPFLCLRLSPMPPRWKRGIEVAVLAAGAVGFLDMSSLEKTMGREGAEEELRRTVLSHLSQVPSER
jgi:response regulator RpfG family c-di-GMP phosphodiesterase